MPFISKFVRLVCTTINMWSSLIFQASLLETTEEKAVIPFMLLEQRRREI